jgi:hypothetical protein
MANAMRNPPTPCPLRGQAWQEPPLKVTWLAARFILSNDFGEPMCR